MSDVIEQVKMDNIKALKEKNTLKREVLSVVVGKFVNLCIEKKSKGLDATEADMLMIIQKTIKELNDSAQDFIKVDRHDKAAEIMQQVAYIHNYLPKQLTEDEIRQIVLDGNFTTVQDIMKYFKTNYAGQVDMKLVSEIAREDIEVRGIHNEDN